MQRQQLMSEYQESDVLFLHVNNYEAFHRVLPSKLFEYAAIGKPIWAGIDGYAANFIKTEISNAGIFHPGDVDEAERVFANLEMGYYPRIDFIAKYQRNKIMRSMANEIRALISHE